MDGWMDDERMWDTGGWMVGREVGGWMDGCWMNGWMRDEWMDGCWMNGWMNVWEDGCGMDGCWKDGWMNGWTEERMDSTSGLISHRVIWCKASRCNNSSASAWVARTVPPRCCDEIIDVKVIVRGRAAMVDPTFGGWVGQIMFRLGFVPLLVVELNKWKGLIFVLIRVKIGRFVPRTFGNEVIEFTFEGMCRWINLLKPPDHVLHLKQLHGKYTSLQCKATMEWRIWMNWRLCVFGVWFLPRICTSRNSFSSRSNADLAKFTAGTMSFSRAMIWIIFRKNGWNLGCLRNSSKYKGFLAVIRV